MDISSKKEMIQSLKYFQELDLKSQMKKRSNNNWLLPFK